VLFRSIELILFPHELEGRSTHYCLITLIKDKAHIIGLISKEEFIKKKRSADYGYGERFCVHNSELDKLTLLNIVGYSDE
jgi:hypothetical protein